MLFGGSEVVGWVGVVLDDQNYSSRFRNVVTWLCSSKTQILEVLLAKGNSSSSKITCLRCKLNFEDAKNNNLCEDSYNQWIHTQGYVFLSNLLVV